MKCELARDLLSAVTDGETTSEETTAVAQHVEHCSACSSYSERLDVLDRQIRIRPAEPVPDLVSAVTARARPARLGRGGWLRPALAWIALVMFAQSIPALILGNTAGTDEHIARHLGAFGVALAIGFAFSAWKPHRAFGLLPFTAALVGTTLVSLGADILGSGRNPLSESVHLTELIGLTLLWMISGSAGWRGWRGRSDHRRRLPRFDPLQ
jgi:predicted anti-sigma-YlaC factor YlaD